MSTTLIFLVLFFSSTMHIQFVVNMDRIMTWVYGSPQYSLEEPIVEELIENESPTLVTFSRNHGFFSWSPLIATVSDKGSELALLSELLEKVHVEITSPDQRMFTTAELLSKVVAYRDLKVGERIPLPMVTRDLKPVLVSYRVDTVFNLWKGIPAFGLIAEDPDFEPILLFRGTDFFSGTERSFYSILSNLDQRGVAFSLFQKGASAIHAWLKTMSENGVPATVIGYSQGGALAIYTAIFERDYVGEVIAFNPPGVSQEIQTEWRNLSLPLTLFISQGDFVSKKGSLIGKIYVLFVEPLRAPIAMHVTLVSGEPTYRRAKATIP